MAVAALNVAQEMGIAVPGDLSIAAGDDTQLCVLVRPGLTALSWDIQAYGRDTARVLMEMVEGGPPRSFQQSTARLLVRASTGPSPRG
jgi:DNA-binding LacI/PurR family transcriptional regulator